MTPGPAPKSPGPAPKSPGPAPMAPAPAPYSGPAPQGSGPAPKGSGPAPISPAPSPVKVSPAADLRELVWNTGQKIQSAPLVINTTQEFTTKPSGYSSQTTPQSVAYTISFDIFVNQTQPVYTGIFSHGALDNWDSGAKKPKPNARLPFVEFYKNSTRLQVEHAEKQGTTIKRNHDSSATGLPTNQWVNIVIRVENGTATVYRNGVSDFTFSGDFYWPNAANDKWYWSPSGSVAGTVKVANFYFWPSALTPVQVGNLKVPTAPTPGVATTYY